MPKATNKTKKTLITYLITAALLFTGMSAVLTQQPADAQRRQGVGNAQCRGSNCNQNRNNQNNNPQPGCGRGNSRVKTKINLGCNGAHHNPIIDLSYAFIRFLSFGVGVVAIASIVFAGIQYSTSEGNPEKTQQAKERIRNSILALLIYLFIFAIVQYLVPGGLF